MGGEGVTAVVGVGTDTDAGTGAVKVVGTVWPMALSTTAMPSKQHSNTVSRSRLNIIILSISVVRSV